ncbi:MAG: hypothetical protein GY850_04970 [bacterium]|nr:hypothetical protein [bacterium]
MNNQPRKVINVVEPQTVLEGAGVRLKRSIATATLDNLDPFLLLLQVRRTAFAAR